MGKMLAVRRCVIIERDVMEKISKVVWDHEVPMLREMYGEGNVEVVPIPKEHAISKADTVKPIEASDEYVRLGDAYGRHPDTGTLLVEYVYEPPFRRMLERMYPLSGKPSVPPLTEVSKEESLDDELDEEQQSLDDNGNIERDKLKAMLKANGVEFNGRNSRDELDAVLRDWIENELIDKDIDYEDDATTAELVEIYEANKG